MSDSPETDGETDAGGEVDVAGEDATAAGPGGTAESAPDSADSGTGDETGGAVDGRSAGRTGDRAVSAAVVTVASHRTIEEDDAGDAIVAALDEAGHHVATRNLVRNDYDGVQSEVATLVKRDDVEAIVATGCTGVAPDDVTIEAVEPLLDKELPGFGEAYRRRSAERLGSRVVSTRATAGVASGVPVFCLPGGEAAAQVGAAELVAPEVGDVVAQANPEEDGEEECAET